MKEKLKIKVSSFVANILENDALRFGFIKNNKSSKNALLNKLIPTLLAVRKERRSEIERILKDEFNRKDSENIYSAVNTVVDRVYFNNAELNILDEYIWLRPSKFNKSIFNEIETSEAHITAQDVSVYVRALLNEYSCLPQYKRELLVFDNEMDIFSDACSMHQITYFTDSKTDTLHKVFPFDYRYGYLYEQENYCIIFDIERNIIKALPLHRITNIYTIKGKYNPPKKLIDSLQDYTDSREYDTEIYIEENS